MPIIADDYGLGPKHSSVMRELLDAGAIDGVSVMTGGPEFESDVSALRTVLRGNQAVGLHFNLTHAFTNFDRRTSVRNLLGGQLIGRIDRAWVRREIETQWEQFVAVWGRPPAFVDGHEHVHALPSVARELARFLVSRNFSGSVRYVGTPHPIRRLFDASNLGTAAKSIVLSLLGAVQKRILLRHRIRHNTDFGGIAPLNDKEQLARHYGRLLGATNMRAIVMVHPGSEQDAHQTPGHDPNCRRFEAEFLKRRLDTDLRPAGH